MRGTDAAADVRGTARRRPSASTRRAQAARWLAAAAVVASLATAAPAPASAQADAFSDVAEGVHKPAIDALAALGLFEGTLCAGGDFCPGEAIKRSTMAVWLIRALEDDEPAASGASRFADVDADDWQAPYIERLAELEITVGCRKEPLRYCPDRTVTRAQMASFLVRALDLAPADPAGFTDIAGNTHEANINALAAANITVGCRKDPLRYCPDQPVKRGQMATFLARALGLFETPQPAPAASSPYPATVILPDTIITVDTDGQRHIFSDDFTTDVGTTRAALSPDGRRIAYTTDTALYLINIDGTNKTRLAQGAFASPDRWREDPRLTWSPDSTRIAYTTAGTALHIADTDDASTRELTISFEYFNWSPDSSRIAFSVPSPWTETTSTSWRILYPSCSSRTLTAPTPHESPDWQPAHGNPPLPSGGRPTAAASPTSRQVLRSVSPMRTAQRPDRSLTTSLEELIFFGGGRRNGRPTAAASPHAT